MTSWLRASAAPRRIQKQHGGGDWQRRALSQIASRPPALASALSSSAKRRASGLSSATFACPSYQELSSSPRRLSPSSSSSSTNARARGVLVAVASAAPSGSDNPAAPKSPSYRDKLAAYGVAGVVAYGILNTLYYTCAFAFAWFWLQPNGPPGAGAGGRLGWPGAVKAAGAVMAGTWLGSQVTKAARAAGAIALAPAVDALLERVGARLGGERGEKRRRKGRAVAVVVAASLVIWFAVFLGVLASVA